MTLVSTIKQWRANWGRAREWDALEPDERQALARDIGVSEELLAGLAARGPEAAAELPQLLAVLSLNPREVGLEHPAMMRDMTVVCCECTEKTRCRQDLARGQAQAAYAEYCPNAETLRELRERSAACS